MAERVSCTKTIKFCAGHRLMNHEGKCKSLHGHGYVLNITVESIDNTLDSIGRVADFGVIKSIFGEWIDTNWDHGVILNSEDTNIINFMKENDFKCYIMHGNPTAENMAQHLITKFNYLINSYDSINFEVTHIELYETDTCKADAYYEV